MHDAQITPRHPDGTLCGHDLSSEAAAQECPGRAGHVLVCACGWTRTARRPARLVGFHRTHSVGARGGAR
ncbi:hypothetical protein [Streptomyces variabilis]